MMNVFQTPWLLLSISLVILIIAAVFRQSFENKQRWWQLLIPFALIAGSFGLDYFVRTDYEIIVSTLKSARKSIVAEDVDRLATVVSPEYSDRSHRSKEQLISFLRSFFSTTKIAKSPRRSSDIVITGDTAEAEMLYRVHLEPNSAYTQAASMYFVKVRFTLAKTGDKEWQLVRTELVELNFQPFHWGDL